MHKNIIILTNHLFIFFWLTESLFIYAQLYIRVLQESDKTYRYKLLGCGDEKEKLAKDFFVVAERNWVRFDQACLNPIPRTRVHPTCRLI